MSKKAAGKALTGEKKQLFIDCVDLGVDNWRRSEANSVDCPTNTKPQLGQLADEIRCLFRQNTATGIFEKLGRDTPLLSIKVMGSSTLVSRIGWPGGMR